jgi:hypothetical protein
MLIAALILVVMLVLSFPGGPASVSDRIRGLTRGMVASLSAEGAAVILYLSRRARAVPGQADGRVLLFDGGARGGRAY